MHKQDIWVNGNEFYLFSKIGQDPSPCLKFKSMYLYVCSYLIYMYLSIGNPTKGMFLFYYI